MPQGFFQHLVLGVLSQTAKISLDKTSYSDCCFTPSSHPSSLLFPVISHKIRNNSTVSMTHTIYILRQKFHLIRCIIRCIVRQSSLDWLVFLLGLDLLSNRNLHTVMIENVSFSFPSVPSALCILKVVDIWNLFSPFTKDICSCSKYNKAFLISREPRFTFLVIKFLLHP